MVKTKRAKAIPDFLLDYEREREAPAIQIVAIRYADGREVTVEAVGDDALLTELREYLRLRELDRAVPGLRPYDLRDLAKDIDEVRHEQLSDRNRRPGPRKARAVSKKDLLAFRNEFEYKYGRLRGWKKAACLRFEISLDILNARL